MEVLRYQIRYPYLDAVQWNGGADEAEEIIDWIQKDTLNAGGSYHVAHRVEGTGEIVLEYMILETLDGPKEVNVGDFIVRRNTGDFYPFNEEDFNDTYEEVW